MINIEKMQEQMRKHDMFIVEVKKGKFLYLKTPADYDFVRTIDTVFTMHSLPETKMNIERMLEEKNKVRVYYIGQYNRDEFKAFLQMLLLFQPDDLMNELRIAKTIDERTQKYLDEINSYKDICDNNDEEDLNDIPEPESYDVFNENEIGEDYWESQDLHEKYEGSFNDELNDYKYNIIRKF